MKAHNDLSELGTEELEGLSPAQMDKLLRAPALVSVLAASTDEGSIDRTKKADAIWLSHLRTYTAEPRLQPFYCEVEKVFKLQLQGLIDKFIPLTEHSKEAIREQLEEVNNIIDTLDDDYADALRTSLKSYAHHIEKVHRNFVEYFFLPLKINGLTD